MTETPPPAKTSPIRRFVPLILIGGALAAFVALGGADLISLDTLRENRAVLAGFVQDHFVVALLGFVLLYAALVAISFPGASLLTVVGGFLFGTWLGTLGVVVGATLGAVAIFKMARTAFGQTLKAKADGRLLKTFEDGLRENELSYLFILRLVPLFPFWLVNIAPAFFDVKLRNFALATFFGIIPGSLVYAGVGNGIGAVFDRGEEAKLSGLMFQPSVILPVLGLVGLALIPVIYKKVKGAPA